MWNSFFAAASSASAALAGLVFVALSVNISNIIRAPHLPSRAGATIGALMLILVCSMATLIPQRPAALGIQVIIFTSCAGWMQLRATRAAFIAHAERNRPLWEAVLGAVLGQAQVLPFVVAAVLLMAGGHGGLYWMAAGCISVFIFSVLNAWVLLVEILR
jgi:modulator of FtsH protease